MATQTLQAIKATGADILTENLDRPFVFETAAAMLDGKRICLTCTSMVSVDSERKIRHGSAFVLRSLMWLVIDQPVSHPLLGCSLLEAVGLNTSKLSSAVADRFARSIDIERQTVIYLEKGDGQVLRVMEVVFHADEGEDENGVEDR